MKYNYKCVVAKNGKRYYKNISGKWKRITTKIGEKAEKGKRKYGMHLPGRGREKVSPGEPTILTQAALESLKKYRDKYQPDVAKEWPITKGKDGIYTGCTGIECDNNKQRGAFCVNPNCINLHDDPDSIGRVPDITHTFPYTIKTMPKKLARE